MTRFNVEFSEKANKDLEGSFEWGCEKWGPQKAAEWYFDIRDRMLEALGRSPLGCPLAPDNHRFAGEARVLTIGRYNVLFHIRDKTVIILHVRGPFTSR